MPLVPQSRSKSSRKADPKATLAFQLQCAGTMGVGLQPEWIFHPTRKWRFDLAYPNLKLAIEIEGGTFLPNGGRHNRGAGMREDLQKYAEATILGWRILRVLPEWVANGKAFGLVERALKTREGG